MAKPSTKLGKLEDQLKGEHSAAWEALSPLKETWTDKEKALLAQTTDSFSGSVTRARVTDAALSTLAYERQARVAAQLPTGKVYATGKSDEGKAKLANIVLQRYIIPNAGRDFDMLILQRLWGVYASVYGSMPMFYDYCVEDDYIGPYAQLVDPRCFLPQPGFNSTKTMKWAMISTVVGEHDLQNIIDRKSTTYDLNAIKKLLDMAKDGRPTRDDDSDKDSFVSSTRYSKAVAKGRIELVTKYESGDKGRWITFAPDYNCIIIRNIPNPHKSGRIPVVMRHCFPLMNSIYGLGDFERGMKLQKAKDSILGLFLEGAKNRIYPPLKIDTTKVTASTIKYKAGGKWIVNDMNGVQPVTFGNDSLNEFQGTHSALHTMLMNQFGTSDTSVSTDQTANSSFGKTPQALKMLESRENARDTWDRFMHEKAVEELYEGMLNLLAVKMEKPINFTIFEQEIQQIANDYGDGVLDILDNGRYGKMTVAKKDLKPSSANGLCYMIDANSSMRQDDDAQMNTSMQMLQIMSDPNIQAELQQQGWQYDRAEHIKSLFINSGMNDWERILKEISPEDQNNMAQDQALQEQAMQEEAIRQQAMQQVDAIPPELQQYMQEQGIEGATNG